VQACVALSCLFLTAFVAQTCFSRLNIPTYSLKRDMLLARLRFAITNTDTFGTA
jgi:hypothetical protein